jgi:diacylglycerol kinase (ATP)
MAPDQPRTRRMHPRVAAFWYAFEGVAHLFQTQRHAQFHAAAGMVVIALGVGFGIERFEWIALVAIMTLVLAAEGVNTAIEAVVDLVSPAHHPLAKIAKDVAAGTVLLTAIGALVVGLLIFLPRIWSLAAPLLGAA